MGGREDEGIRPGGSRERGREAGAPRVGGQEDWVWGKIGCGARSLGWREREGKGSGEGSSSSKHFLPAKAKDQTGAKPHSRTLFAMSLQAFFACRERRRRRRRRRRRSSLRGGGREGGRFTIEIAEDGRPRRSRANPFPMSNSYKK